MTSRKMFFGSKPRYIYPTKDFDDKNNFEFDEVDIWNNSNDQSFEPKKPLPSSRSASSKKASKKMEIIIQDHNHRTRSTQTPASASLPVKILDWSKILKIEYKEHENTDEEDVPDGDDGDRIPPHEYLARRRGDSFSVHEGIGRTLKGRDLHRVRNAVWKKLALKIKLNNNNKKQNIKQSLPGFNSGFYGRDFF